MQELWFLRLTRRLMLFDIHIKFREDILNGFQVIGWPRFYVGQSSKGNNSKRINARVMVLALCTLSNVDWYLHEVYWRYLEQVLSYRADTILWRKKFQGK